MKIKGVNCEYMFWSINCHRVSAVSLVIVISDPPPWPLLTTAWLMQLIRVCPLGFFSVDLGQDNQSLSGGTLLRSKIWKLHPRWAEWFWLIKTRKRGETSRSVPKSLIVSTSRCFCYPGYPRTSSHPRCHPWILWKLTIVPTSGNKK